jgi:hypothetical protein
MRWDLAAAAHRTSQAAARTAEAAGAATVVLSWDQFAVGSESGVFRVEDGPVAVASDRDLTAALANGIEVRNDTVSKLPSAPTVNRIMAQTAFAALRGQLDGNGANLVAALPRSLDVETNGLALLETLVDSGWIEPVSLEELLDRADQSELEWGPAADWPGPPAEDVSQLLELTAQASAFASLTPEPDSYLAKALPPLLAPLSNAVPTGSARAAAAGLALHQAASEVPPVSVVVGSDVNLISDDGRVPVVVENSSNQQISGLVVKLTTKTNALRVEAPVAINLAPGESTTARVPVHALANGLFKVDVTLVDEQGRSVTKSASLTMRVRAEWESVGSMIIGGVLVLILVAGVMSAVRKRRRQQADTSTGPAAGDTRDLAQGERDPAGGA